MKQLPLLKKIPCRAFSAIVFFFFIFFASFKNNKITSSKISMLAANQSEPLLKATLSDKSRKLPLYGFNGNNINGPSWSNRSFRDSVASLHLRVIRYPGGSVSNWWQWQKGGFVDDPSLPPKFKKRYTPSSLQDLKLLLDETNCDVVFTLNMVTKDLSDQIEMLSYAQSLKIPVKWVELGNEFTNSKNPGRQKFLTAEDYGKTCQQWIDAIKSRFPDVKIAVVGGNRNYNANVKNWNNIVLQNASNADAIVAHLYPRKESVTDNSGINFQKLFNEFVNDSHTQGFGSMTGNKSIWITEYNINWASDDNDRGGGGGGIQSGANTWSQALATLLMTSTATSALPNATLILNHNISNSSIYAAIETERGTFKKMPNGIGMSSWLMASDHMDSMTKLIFENDNHQASQDYQLFGWKFFNNATSALLLVNLQDSPIKINMSNLISSNATIETKYADKNSVINSATDIKFKKIENNNGLIELPEYSITVVRN